MSAHCRRRLPVLLAALLAGGAPLSHADSIDQPCKGVVFVKQEDGSWVVLHDGATLVDKGDGNYEIWEVGAKNEYDSTFTRSHLLNLYCRDSLV